LEEQVRHIGFTGTRKGMSTQQKDQLVLFLIAQPVDAVLHHGDCIGADRQAYEVAKRFYMKTHGHPPSNGNLRAYTENDFAEEPKDYHDRDWDIVKMSDVLVATPKEATEIMRGSGTWLTIRYARQAKKPYIVWGPNGEVIERGE
jgi:hypothetical protein